MEQAWIIQYFSVYSLLSSIFSLFSISKNQHSSSYVQNSFFGSSLNKKIAKKKKNSKKIVKISTNLTGLRSFYPFFIKKKCMYKWMNCWVWFFGIFPPSIYIKCLYFSEMFCILNHKNNVFLIIVLLWCQSYSHSSNLFFNYKV